MSKKKYDDDDGRSIADMNVEGMPWYVSKKQQQKQEELKELDLTKAEKKAIRRAIFWQAFKTVAIITVGFGIAICLMILWLK